MVPNPAMMFKAASVNFDAMVEEDGEATDGVAYGVGGGAELDEEEPFELILGPSMSVTEGSTGIQYLLPRKTSIPSGEWNEFVLSSCD